MGVQPYEVTADGSDFDQLWTEGVAKALGRIADVGLYPQTPSDYVIFPISGIYYRYDGESGIVDDSNADADTLITTAVDSIKADTQWRKITFKGTFEVASEIDVFAATTLVLEGGHFDKTANIDHIWGISDAEAAQSTDVILRNMTLDENSQGFGNGLVIGNLKGGGIYNVNSSAFARALSMYRITGGAASIPYLPERITVIGGKWESTDPAFAASCFLVGGRHHTVINPEITGGKSGLQIYQNTFGHTYDITAIKPYIHDVNNRGISVVSPHVNIIKPYVDTCVGEGIEIIPSGEAVVLAGSVTNIVDVKIDSPYITNSDTAGLSIRDARHVSVTGGLIEGNASSGIVIQGDDIGVIAPTEDINVTIRDVTVKNNNLTIGTVGIVVSNVEAVTLNCLLDNVRVFDDQGTPTQIRAVQVTGDQDIILKVAHANWSGTTYNFLNNNTGTNTRVTSEQDRTGVSGDLSAAPTNIVCGHFVDSAFLLSATLVYTAASGAANLTTLKIGKETDDDYYYTGNSEANKAIWYTNTVTLLQNDIAAGDSVLFTWVQDGANTAEIMLVIDYMKGA